MFIIRSHLSQTIISGIHLSFQGWGSWKLYNGQRFQGHSKTSNLRPFKMIVNSWVYNILVLKNMLFLWLPNGHGSLIMISSIQRWTTHESVCPAWNYIYIYIWILWLANAPKEVETHLHCDASFGKNALVSRGEAILGLPVLGNLASCENVWQSWFENWVTLYSSLCAETKEHQKTTSNESTK